jgi:hypothetical protein
MTDPFNLEFSNWSLEVNRVYTQRPELSRLSTILSTMVMLACCKNCNGYGSAACFAAVAARGRVRPFDPIVFHFDAVEKRNDT